MGRPIGSEVRNNMVEILFAKGEMHGYRLWKEYVDIFPKVSRRLIYYHLQKGLDTGEFEIARIEKESGDYSWGSKAERKYFRVGGQAKPRGSLK